MEHTLIGRPPAVHSVTGLSLNKTWLAMNRTGIDEYAEPLFAGHGKLRGVCAEGRIKILALLRDGVYTELLAIKRAENNEQWDIMPSQITGLQGWVYTMEDEGMRIDCKDALDFYCIVPEELIAEAVAAKGSD